MKLTLWQPDKRKLLDHIIHNRCIYMYVSYNFPLVMSLGTMRFGSALVGQGEVGWCTQRVQTAWLLLGLAVQRPWSALGGPFLYSFAQMG